MPAHIPHTPGAEPQIQPLPAAYAPTPEQESTFLAEYGPYLTTARLPKAGEHVVIDLAYVSWLAITGDARPVTEENSILITAPATARRHRGDLARHHRGRCQRPEPRTRGPMVPAEGARRTDRPRQHDRTRVS